MNRSLTRRLPALVAATALAALGLGAPAQAQYDADHAPTSAPCLQRDGHGDSGAARGRHEDHSDLTNAQRIAIEKKTDSLLKKRGSSSSRAGLASAVTVPVYVHVVRDANGNGNVTDATIAKQIDVLNKTFSGGESSEASDTGIRFSLSGTYRYNNTTWHNDGSSTTYRSQTRKGGKNALNIWFVDLDGYGVATFPWDYRSGGPDGIRVDYTTVPGGSATNYNLGETATHEAGHWLGLYHTFEGDVPCDSVNDEVADTPAQESESRGCPTGRDSCTAPGLDPIHNYMDYSYDSCYNQFTPGQSARIAKYWQAYRA